MAVEESQPRGSKTACRILIVDNEQVVCDVLSRFLSEEGYTNETTFDAKTATRKIARKDYQLCIIDVRMPYVSGEQLYKIIKERYPNLAERVVFITGDTMSRDTEQFLISAGRPCLPKPFDYHELTNSVKEALALRQ